MPTHHQQDGDAFSFAKPKLQLASPPMSRHQDSSISRIALNTLSSLVCLALTMTTTSVRGADESEKSLKRQLRVFCGSLIDGVSNHPLSSQTLTISDGTIISISETLPSTEIDLDLSDYTCLPGLINTHVHFDANPEDAADYGVYARRTQADNLALILKNAETTVHTGFTRFDTQAPGSRIRSLGQKQRLMRVMRLAPGFELQGPILRYRVVVAT